MSKVKTNPPRTYTLKTTAGRKDRPPNDNRGQMLNRASLAIATLASKAENHPELGVLRITAEETIATNGVFLGRISHPVVDRHAVDVNAPVELVDRAIAPCSIPREVALHIARLIPKATEESPHHFAFIDIAQAVGGKLHVVVKQADATQNVEIGEVQLEFPNTRAVMPSRRGAALRFTVNHRLLAGVLAAARHMGLDNELKFYIPDSPEKAILIEGQIAETEQDASFVIMPMRSSELIEKKRATKDAPPELIPRKCIYCGCTDEHACDPPCSWLPAKDAGGRDVCDAKACLEKLGRVLARKGATKRTR